MGGGELGNVQRPELAAILHAGIWIVRKLEAGVSERSIVRELDLTPGMVWKLEQLRNRISLPVVIPRPRAWPSCTDRPVVADAMPELSVDLDALF